MKIVPVPVKDGAAGTSRVYKNLTVLNGGIDNFFSSHGILCKISAQSAINSENDKLARLLHRNIFKCIFLNEARKAKNARYGQYY